jgi:hypothetical protein
MARYVTDAQISPACDATSRSKSAEELPLDNKIA